MWDCLFSFGGRGGSWAQSWKLRFFSTKNLKEEWIKVTELTLQILTINKEACLCWFQFSSCLKTTHLANNWDLAAAASCVFTSLLSFFGPTAAVVWVLSSSENNDLELNSVLCVSNEFIAKNMYKINYCHELFRNPYSFFSYGISLCSLATAGRLKLWQGLGVPGQETVTWNVTAGGWKRESKVLAERLKVGFALAWCGAKVICVRQAAVNSWMRRAGPRWERSRTETHSRMG